MADRVSSPVSGALPQWVLVADGAMAMMPRSQWLGGADFAGPAGRDEILNVTRPDVVRAICQQDRLLSDMNTGVLRE